MYSYLEFARMQATERQQEMIAEADRRRLLTAAIRARRARARQAQRQRATAPAPVPWRSADIPQRG